MSKIADKIKQYMSSKGMKAQDFYNAVSWDRSKYYRVVSEGADLGINEILEIFEKLEFSDNEKINFLTGIIIEAKPEGNKSDKEEIDRLKHENGVLLNTVETLNRVIGGNSRPAVERTRFKRVPQDGP